MTMTTNRHRTHKNRVQVRLLRECVTALLADTGPQKIEQAVGMSFADYVRNLIDATHDTHDGLNQQDSIVKMFAVLPRSERKRLLGDLLMNWCTNCGAPIPSGDTGFDPCQHCGFVRLL